LRDGGSVSPDEKLKEVDTVTLEDLVVYAKNWNRKVYMEFYMTGNLLQEQALKIAKDVEQFSA
jgi:secreted Zn-dependent insulinase-like peptidase